MSHLRCPVPVIAETLGILRAAGRQRKEHVVLWLASRAATSDVALVHDPLQQCERDRFWVPAASMAALIEVIGEKRLSLVAQIHTHPRRAFHSDADNAWSIVSHVGGLSLVIPRFARDTQVGNFYPRVVSYRLSPNGSWDYQSTASVLEIV